MGLDHLDMAMSFAVLMLILSLLITTAVQIAIAVSNLRGRNLAWGVRRLIEQVLPDLTDRAAEITREVLRHPTVSHSFGAPATALRSDELKRLLGELAAGRGRRNRKGREPLSASTKAALAKALGMLPLPPETLAQAQAAAEDLERALRVGAERLPATLSAVLPAGRKLAAEFETWFGTVMDRTTERFVLRTRLVTAALAVLLAFGLHADSLRILGQLSEDPELRRGLLTQAEELLAQGKGLVEPTALASEALATVGAEHPATSGAERLRQAPRDLRTREQGESWLVSALPDPAKREPLLEEYKAQFDRMTKARLEALAEAAHQLRARAHQQGIVLFSTPDVRAALEERAAAGPLAWYDEVVVYLAPYWTAADHHFLGTMMTALFLSLGAPFWFNLLRTMADLRPPLARKIQPKGETEVS